MTASSFDEALKRVLVHEGGYTNHPKDPGGATNKGVTQAVYHGYRDRMKLPRQSVRYIRDTEVADIYRRQYWDAIRGDDLPAGLDYCTFDAAVNSGVGQAAKWLQRTVGVPADGQIGEATLEAARKANPATAINGSCDKRLAMLKGLSTWGTFGKGWSRRVADVRAVSLDMAARLPLPPVASEPASGSGKGRPEDRSLSDIAKSPEGIAAGTSIGASILNAAANPGPLAWALAFAIVIAVAVGAFYFVRRLRSA